MTDRHENNFTVLRLLAASLVIVGHAFDLQRHGDWAKQLHGPMDWARQWTGYSIGEIAVAAFFSISGYLIFNSIVRRPDIVRYARSRALRILPGLWVMLIVTWLAGAAWSFLPPADYFRDVVGFKYLGLNALVIPIFYELPRVFEGNPSGPTVNGSLWTLRYELFCYVGLGLMIMTGLVMPERRRVVVLIALAAAAVWLLLEQFAIGVPTGGALYWVHRMYLLGFAFALGMAVAEFKITVRLWHVGAALALAVVTSRTFLIWPALCLLSAAFVFWFAFLDAPILRKARELPDISYGVYIYAFPIQQAMIFSLGVMAPMLHAPLALAITIVPAALSWYLVEKPALALKQSRKPAWAKSLS